MSVFLEYVRQRIRNNKNFLCSITGPTGSGKSYSALTLGQALDPAFSIERVAFSPLEFMEILDTDLPAGSVIVFDEAGVGISSQEWQSVANRLINYVLQTFRHKNYIVLFTTPHMGFIAAQSRKLFHCHMETTGILKKARQCRLKPLLIQVNQRSGDVYFKYLRVKRPGQKPQKITRIRVPLPKKALRNAYERKKTAYTQELNKGILDDLRARHAKEKPTLTARQQEVVDLLSEGLTIDAVAENMQVSERNVYAHMELIQKKGWRIKAVKDGSRVECFEVTGP